MFSLAVYVTIIAAYLSALRLVSMLLSSKGTKIGLLTVKLLSYILPAFQAA